jgi:beta-phosphoglucomutase
MSQAEDRDVTADLCMENGMGTCLLAEHRFRFVLWDWDGVLVDSRDNFYRAYEMVLREQGITTTPREIFLREGKPTPVLLRAVFEAHDIPFDEDKIEELVVRRREYDIQIGGRELFPSVPRLLQRLRDAGCRNGLVTGSSKSSLLRVLQPEQAPWFDVMVTADDVERGKPNPEPFLRAMRALETEPEACIVIENAPFGIEAARAAGCAVAAVCTTLSREDLSRANWVVKNHDELEILLFGDIAPDTEQKISFVSGESR